ncbi:unknown [Eubacterium sp. CAG:156]|nr:unknown [Eubacterium sp. CAG:156]
MIVEFTAGNSSLFFYLFFRDTEKSYAKRDVVELTHPLTKIKSRLENTKILMNN